MSGERHTARVFVVEDEALIAMELMDRLRGLGFEICGHATRGERALEQIPAARPDAILMDLNLGSGPSGLDVAERLRGVVDAPVVFLTAYTDAELSERAARLDSFAYLVKPFQPEALRANLQMAILRHAAERELAETNRRLEEARAALEAKSRALAEREARYRQLFRDATVGVCRASMDGTILEANPAFAELVGRSPEALAGTRLRELYVDPDECRLATAGDRIDASDLRWRRADGETAIVELSARVLRDEDGRPSHLQAYVRDLTERARAEEKRRSLEAQLRQAQKMEALGTLSAGIAHDFNNLLTAIVANVKLARDDLAPSHPVQESLDDIATAASRATGLVQQILTVGRRGTSDRARVALPPLVEETGRLLRSTLPAGIRLTVSTDDGAPPVVADATQLQQVLMNLATNAWQAIDGDHGQIEIRVDGVTLPDGAHAELAPGRHCRIRVIDDGAGMDADTAARIFEPFFTTKHPGRGTGLGLSVVHGIVKEHGGAVRVDSAPGEGTTLTIFLPAAEPRPSPAPPARRKPAVSGRGRLLYVDDEAILVASTTKLLERLGYEVTGFTDPRRALEAVAEDPGRVDLVITDYQMPALNGLELARELRRLRPDLPVALISGRLDRGEPELEAAGIRHRVNKPFHIDQLARLVDRILRPAS